MSEKRKRHQAPDSSSLDQEAMQEWYKNRPEDVGNGLKKEIIIDQKIQGIIAEIDELTDQSESPDINEEAKKSAHQLAEESNYADLFDRYVNEEITEEIFREFQDYKNKLQQILSSNNKMEKEPTIQNKQEASAGKKMSQEEKSKKIMTIEEIYAEDLKDSKSKENINLAKEEIGKRYRKKVEGKKKSAEEEVASATTNVIENKDAIQEDKDAAEASQKTAEEKIDAAAGKAVQVEAGPELKPQPESEMQRKIREKAEEEHARLSAEKEKLNPRETQIWAWRIVNKKFDTGQAEIPADFQTTPETEEAVKNFLANRNLLVEAEKAYKRSGAKGGPEEMWFKNREIFANRSLDALKRQMFNDIVAEKAGALKAQGLSDKQINEMLEKTELPYFHKAILNFAKSAETDLAEHRTRELCEPREQGMISKAMEKYRNYPRWKRLLVGGAIAGGIGAGIGLWGGGGLAVAAYVGGTRAARSLLGGSVAATLNTVSDFWIGRKYGEKREKVESETEQASLARMQAEIAQMKKEGQNWLENEDKKLRLMEMIDEDAKNSNAKIQELLAQERRAKGKAALMSGVVGGLSAWAAYANWDSLIGGGKPSGIGAAALEHKTGVAAGVGGPHGAESMPAGGKPEGMPLGSLAGEPTLEEAGKAFATGDMRLGTIEVHKGDTVWGLIDKKLEGQYGTTYEHLGEARKTFAIDALKDKFAAMSPDQLKAIGISSGNINELNIGDKIDFDKLMTDENMIKAMEGAKGLSQEQLMSIHENLKGVSGVDRVSDLPPQTAEAIKISGEKIAVTIAEMESPAGKIGGILNGFNEWDKSGLKKAAEQMGGWDKFMNMKASELFPSGDLSQPGATNVYLNKFAYGLQRLTNDAPTLHDGKTTVKDILNTIKPEKVFGAEYKG